jgi:hypothetical protein
MQDQGSIAKYTSTIKEKTMAPQSRLFQASCSASLLCSATLTIALLVPAAPARAETVTLVCQQEAGPHMTESGGSFTLRLDYDRKIVDFLQSDGAVSYSAAATITEGNVQWKTDLTKAGAFLGQLNRLSGQGNATYWDERQFMHQMSGPCRRATQKF